MQAWWGSNYGGIDKFYNRNSVNYGKSPEKPSDHPANQLSSGHHSHQGTNLPADDVSCYASSIASINYSKSRHLSLNQMPISDDVFNSYTELIPGNPYFDDDNISSISASTRRLQQNPVGKNQSMNDDKEDDLRSSFMSQCKIPDKDSTDKMSSRKHKRKTYGYDGSFLSSRTVTSKDSEEYRTHRRLRSEFMSTQHRSITELPNNNSIIDFFGDLKRQHTLDTIRRTQLIEGDQAGKQDKCTMCHHKLSGSVVQTASKKYHEECVTCYVCGGKCGSKYYEQEITVPTQFDIEGLVDDDSECDSVSITAPLRVDLAGSIKSSSSCSGFSTIDSPVTSTFEIPLSATSSRTSVDSSEHHHHHHHHQGKFQAKEIQDIPEIQCQTKTVILCEYDMYKKLGLICDCCEAPITDDLCVKLPGNKTIHSKHITCGVCNVGYDVNSEDQSFFRNGDHFYCKQHYDQYFINMMCDSCGKDISQESNIKMVQRIGDAKVKYYDAQCYKQSILG
ncbi:hypothetical protein DASC09_031120 [Saccharomycopsis crataegensis]|uniref:LIM zinc-binding domain-containing protein n=1 Tax=Saccharomycopsis crataegensis TaxID=43959 RepID=A0AAV5QLX6_9ASCO|nr:hypothetical protein DASC09_031120 [Saccharomycopsis crataegensis]